MPQFLCIGGTRDGDWLSEQAIRKTKEYTRFDIRAEGKPVLAFKAKYLGDMEAVLILLDGYEGAKTTNPNGDK